MKRLLSILLLVFAFSCVGFAADVELDYMEYPTPALAQAAYVSSDADYKRLLDEDWDALGDWDDISSDGGVSSIDPAGQLYLDARSVTVDDRAAGRSKDIGTIGTGDYWVRVRFKIDVSDSVGLSLRINAETNRCLIYIGNPASTVGDGIAVYNGAAFVNVLSKTWDTGWHTAIFFVHNSQTDVDIWVDKTSFEAADTTDADCSYATLTDGLVIVRGYGTIAGNGEYHIDYLYIGDVINLQCYSESTIKTQGDYSLKGVAVITDSLNDTFTRTVSPAIDLTGKDDWVFYIYSDDRTGSNIKAGIHDSGGTTTESTPDVTDTGVWQKVTVDVSGVTDANKDVIDSIIITPVNADASNTFYLDNVFGQAVATGGGNMELYTSYYQIGLDSANVKAMILSNKEPTSVSLTRTGTGTSLTEGVLSDSDVYNSTYYSFNYSADVSGESSDTCIRAFIESSDTTIHFYGISLLGLE